MMSLRVGMLLEKSMGLIWVQKRTQISCIYLVGVLEEICRRDVDILLLYLKYKLRGEHHTT